VLFRDRSGTIKLTHAKSRIVRMPAENPLIPIPIDRPPHEFVTLELGTDDGVTGVGLTFFGGPLTGALRSAVDALAALAIGEDPLRVEAIAAKLRKAASGAGPGGILTLALAAIDLALWDIKGKVAGLTVHSLLGGSRDRAPTYASGVLMRDYSEAYLAETGPKLVELGFRQMKTHLGIEATVEEALRRIRILRDGIGDDVALMCDANQAWSVHQAIDMGRRLEPFRLFWLEDLIVHDDFQGLARVDTLRAGGITPWIKIAGMAEAFNIPVVSHLFPEVNVHLVAAIPNGLTIEYMPSSLRLFEETPAMVDGQLVVPDRPGLGLEFDQATIERYQVA
jgi:L-alanine-DL-glutamate epimerase-like enolase superfamily enzyme